MATYDPFRDLDRFASSLFDARRGPRRMPMDLYRDGDHYVLTADLPGIDPGSVDIDVDGQLLTIRGLGGDYDEVFLPLHGAHQAHNAAVALAAVESFLGGGQGRLDLDIVREGFASVTSPGRLEPIRRSPTVLLDAAHNPAGAKAIAETLDDEFGSR